MGKWAGWWCGSVVLGACLLGTFVVSTAAPPKPLVETDVTPQRLEVEPARPAAHPVRKIIEQLMPQATQEARDIWFEQMKDLPPGVVADMLNFRKQANAAEPLLPPAEMLPAPRDRPHTLSATTRQALERAARVHRTNLLMANVTGYRQQLPILAAVASGEAIELEHLGTRLAVTVGLYEATQRPLDMALSGPGWFTVTLGDERLYTRNGHFSLDPEGHLGLMTSRGFAPVVPPIQLPETAVQIEVQANGKVSVLEKETKEVRLVGELEVVSFLDDAALRLHPSGCYAATPEAGASARRLPANKANSVTEVRNGVLEGSNVVVEAEQRALDRIHALLRSE